MRILTDRYEGFERVAPGIRALLESFTTSLGIQNHIDCVFIGFLSSYHKMQCKKRGEPCEPLTFPDALVIIIDTKDPIRHLQIPVANDFGISLGINSPVQIKIATYYHALCKAKELIQKEEY